ncbi:MAG TPA: hypothetical protein H9865_02360 [Candidatus Fournierella pullicola]|uniref:Repeat protein (TIGR01451 family) n=1 Tax=Candidatus Allofournierella pullicola TaxID=2838596 RepID=A0A9D2ADI2_9FIRM|nr:hypothetical protein [Candidatus Fournierella pullicola]
MKQYYFRRGVASLMALLALSLLSLRALADEAAPQPAVTAESSSSDSAPAPAPVPGVLISRSEMADLPAGSEAEITVSFRNLGDVTLKSPVAAFTPADGISLAGGASSFLLEDIPGGGTGSVTLKVRAADSASGAQSLGVELRFSYGEDAPASGTASDRLTIPVKAKPAATQPLVLISRSDISSPISPGEVFDLVLTFKNTGSVTVKNAAANVSPSEGLSLLNAASTFPVADIAPGKTGSITVKLQGASQIASASQSLSVDLRYTYDSAGAATSATASDRLNIPAKAASAASSAEKPVPNVVVQKFEYGGKPVAAGGRFPLSFTFENTGTVKVENIVVTVDGGECFTVDGGSNTSHYDALGAGKTLTQELPLQAVPTCKSGAQAITVSFKYEYVDAGKRAPVTSDIRLSVPVSQPDRFQLNPPSAASFTAGEEGEITLAYVNKGRADIGNLEAQLVGEGFESPAKVQYLGNVAAGTSGSIGFALTPEAAGKLDLTVKVTYEDADLQVQTKEFPLSLTVEEGMPDIDFTVDDADAAPARPAWLPVIPATAALAAAGGTAFFLVKRLRRKAAGDDPVADAWSWAETPDESEAEQPKEE